MVGLLIQETLELVALEEFLAPAELSSVVDFALSQEGAFRTSSVVSAVDAGSRVDATQRRSRLLDQLGELESLFSDRISQQLPSVLRRLGLAEVEPSRIDVQMTATNDGEFFNVHLDNASERFRSRKLSFVYFFHREPRAFDGGQLRIFDLTRYDRAAHAGARYTEIEPVQNQIVFFPSGYLHEIALVSCPSKEFADSRFTVNGWIHW
jgi:SM-20-related protein